MLVIIAEFPKNKTDNTCVDSFTNKKRNPLTSPRTGDLWVSKSGTIRICVGNVKKNFVGVASNYKDEDKLYDRDSFIARLIALDMLYSGNMV